LGARSRFDPAGRRDHGSDLLFDRCGSLNVVDANLLFGETNGAIRSSTGLRLNLSPGFTLALCFRLTRCETNRQHAYKNALLHVDPRYEGSDLPGEIEARGSKCEGRRTRGRAVVLRVLAA